MKLYTLDGGGWQVSRPSRMMVSDKCHAPVHDGDWQASRPGCMTPK